jgi:hypothetical protein
MAVAVLGVVGDGPQPDLFQLAADDPADVGGAEAAETLGPRVDLGPAPGRREERGQRPLLGVAIARRITCVSLSDKTTSNTTGLSIGQPYA